MHGPDRAVLNIFLDALFINVFHMGVKGAAIATVIGQGVSAVWALQFLFSDKSILKIRRKYLKIRLKVLLPIMALGVPFTMSATEGLVDFLQQPAVKIRRHHGGEHHRGAVQPVAVRDSAVQASARPSPF